MSSLKEVDEASFTDEVEVHDGPVVVDFSAEWCGPCQQLTPRLEALAEDYEPVKFVKVDVDDNGSLARSFDVKSVPTLLFFQEGEILDRLTGALPRGELVEAIDSTFSLPEGERNARLS